VLADDARPLRVADALEHRGRVADVGEDDRREDAGAEIVGRLSVEVSARELDGLPGHVAFDPRHVAGRNLVGVAWADVQEGAVVHPHDERAGDGVADVTMLARRRARDRSHVGFPTPPGLEDEAADGDLVEHDDLDGAVREPPDLVGAAETFALQPRHASV
jgi:hypothetical protein